MSVHSQAISVPLTIYLLDRLTRQSTATLLEESATRTFRRDVLRYNILKQLPARESAPNGSPIVCSIPASVVQSCRNLTLEAHVSLSAALHEVSSDRISEVLDWLAGECRLPDGLRTGARCTELTNEIPDAADNLVFKHEPPC
jgi:hypothetical protein